MKSAEAGHGAPPAIDGAEKLQELARVTPGAAPVLSVYLDTRWHDEHQRERVRVFLKNESRKAAGMAGGQLAADLAWIQSQGERLVRQELHPAAHGVALFASEARGLRETIPLTVAFEDSFVVADAPRLRPLVEALAKAPRIIVLFVDGESARFIAMTEQEVGEEVLLESSDVVGHHRRGGWAMLLQSRYQRHIHVHRARHFDAVAATLADMIEHQGNPTVVLAGGTRNVAVFRAQLPPRIAGRIVGTIPGARHEPASALASRAGELIRRSTSSDQAGTLDTVLAEAGAGGRAAAGLDNLLDAANRGTVDRLYLLRSFAETGGVCPGCRALHRAGRNTCPWCGKTTSPVDLAEAMIQRSLAAGGTAEIVEVHANLARAGGVAALLRYAAPSGAR